MDIGNILSGISENRYLISMTPAEQLMRLGFEAGMSRGAAVLDLCCGYGAMLGIWNEAFGIRGVGVDRSHEFITEGRKHLSEKGLAGVTLVEADVMEWTCDERFDFVSLSGEDFGGFGGTIRFLEKFAKPGGKLIIGTRYSKAETPPRELTEFEGETLSLGQMNRAVREHGYFITSMATDTHAEWERYVMWSARRNLGKLRAEPENAAHRAWCDTWYDTYFGFRREYEGYVTMVIEKP